MGVEVVFPDGFGVDLVEPELDVVLIRIHRRYLLLQLENLVFSQQGEDLGADREGLVGGSLLLFVEFQEISDEVGGVMEDGSRLIQEVILLSDRQRQKRRFGDLGEGVVVELPDELRIGLQFAVQVGFEGWVDGEFGWGGVLACLLGVVGGEGGGP